MIVLGFYVHTARVFLIQLPHCNHTSHSMYLEAFDDQKL